MATTKLRLRLREVLWNMEVSHAELARRLGCTRQAVGLTLRRSAESLQLGTVVRIADALGVRWSELVEEEPQSTRAPRRKSRC